MLHRINKLQFETTCSTEAQAFEVRNNFAQKQDQISDVIDKVCSKYVSEDELIQIDRIEVDLGNFDIESFEKVFTINLLSKFEQSLSIKITSISPEQKKSSGQSSNVEILVHFLQTGTLPWWADDNTINMNAVFTGLHEQQSWLLYTFLQQHRFIPAIWQRIAMQFNEEVHELIISFFPELTIAEKKLTRWYHLIPGPGDDKNYKINLPVSVAKHQHSFILFHAPVFFNKEKTREAIGQIIHQYAGELTTKMDSNISSEAFAKKIIAYEKETGGERSVLIVDKETENEKGDAANITIESLQPEKFTVHTAGVVLLAPYCKQLFTHLNLLEQGEWKSREAHYKAIHLIRFLVTGEQRCPEYSLVMEKLLCGMEITATIPREIELSELEITEATDLLQAVISNWPKLKNTSIDGLRETFLKRDGILSKKENGWLLQVERRTVDVLLESIPWSYTTLAFTWNSYIIFTEW